MPIWSSRLCCQFLLTNDKMNQQLSEKLISFFPSNLVMFSYLILWTFLVELLVSTRSSKLTKQKKLKAEWFDNPEKLNNEELPPYDSFFSKLLKSNPLEKDYNDLENFTTSSLSSEQALCKLRLNKLPPTGDEKCACLRSIWVSEGMKLSKTFSCGTKPKMLFQLWKQCRRGKNFTTEKRLIC